MGQFDLYEPSAWVEAPGLISMSFRRKRNRHDVWLAICARHADLLSCLPEAAVQSEERFRALVTVGELVDERGRSVVRLCDLSDAEIRCLGLFIYNKAQFDMDAVCFDAFNDEYRRRSR